MRFPAVFFKKDPAAFLPALTDPLFDEGSVSHADKSLNNAASPLFDPCGALVGELMKTSSEKSASIVVMTCLFPADGAL